MTSNLALARAQVGLQALRADRFEIPERLIQVDTQPQLPGARGDLGRRQPRSDQIGLEQLDAVEARAGRGGQLLLKAAAQADGGDTSAHRRLSIGVRIANGLTR